VTDRQLDEIRDSLVQGHGCNDGTILFYRDSYTGEEVQEKVVCPVCSSFRLLAEVKRLRSAGLRERDRCIRIVQDKLLPDSRRSVTPQEVEKAIDYIRREDNG
jgi:hypothetical protein